MAEFGSFHFHSMEGVELVESAYSFSAVLHTDRGMQTEHKGYPPNSSRLPRTAYGGVGLLSSHVIYNTAYAKDVNRIF